MQENYDLWLAMQSCVHHLQNPDGAPSD